MRGSRLTRFAQIEYLVVAFDDLHDKVRLSLCQADVLEALARDEELNKSGGCIPDLQPR
jgi:glutamate--cysteine ligase catalytic subunit